MSLVGAVASLPAVRAEIARKSAVAAARDRLAASVITDAALQGNPVASAFVDEAAGLLQRSRVQRARARRLRAGSARAAAMGYDKLAAMGSDTALAEDAAADASEAAVVRAVRQAHGSAQLGWVSEDEQRILQNKDWLAQATASETERGFAALLDRMERGASNFGVEALGAEGDEEPEEILDDAPLRLAVAAEAFGGDLPIVLGYDCYARIGAILKVGVATLQKRLRNKEARLQKLSDTLDGLEEAGKTGLRVQILRGQIQRLERSIARIKQKLADRAALASKAKASASAAEDVEAAETAVVETESDSPGSEVAPMSEDEKRILQNQARLSNMTAAQAEAALQRVSEDAAKDFMGASTPPQARVIRRGSVRKAGKVALAVARAGGPALVRALRAGDVEKAKAILMARKRRMARLGEDDSVSGFVIEAFGLAPALGAASLDSVAGDALDILGVGGVALARKAVAGRVADVQRAIRRQKALVVARKTRAAQAALGAEEGTVFGGLPAVAIHGKSRPVFLGYFARRANRLGADEVGIEDEAAFGGFFDSIGKWFRNLFTDARKGAEKVERSAAARHAARAQFNPALTERRQDLRRLRRERAEDVREVRQRWSQPLAASRKDLASVLVARRKAGGGAWKASWKNEAVPQPDLPAALAPKAKFELKPAEVAIEQGPKSRTIEDEGGWVYEQFADSVRIVKAPKRRARAEGMVLRPGNRHYKAIVRKFGPLPEADVDDAVGVEGPVESFMRATPKDRAKLLARHVDVLLRKGADEFETARAKGRLAKVEQDVSDGEMTEDDEDVFEDDGVQEIDDAEEIEDGVVADGEDEDVA